MGNDGAGRKKCALQVSVHRPVPELLIRFCKRHALAYSRDIHQDVYPAVPPNHPGSHAVHLLPPADVAENSAGAAPLPRNLTGRTRHHSPVNIRDHDLGAISSQAHRDPFANPLRPSDYNRHLVAEPVPRVIAAHWRALTSI